jgi:hypothetical protein
MTSLLPGANSGHPATGQLLPTSREPQGPPTLLALPWVPSGASPDCAGAGRPRGVALPSILSRPDVDSENPTGWWLSQLALVSQKCLGQAFAARVTHQRFLGKGTRVRVALARWGVWWVTCVPRDPVFLLPDAVLRT